MKAIKETGGNGKSRMDMTLRFKIFRLRKEGSTDKLLRKHRQIFKGKPMKVVTRQPKRNEV